MTDSEVAAANQSFYTVKKRKSPDYSMTIAVAFDVMNIKKAVKNKTHSTLHHTVQPVEWTIIV